MKTKIFTTIPLRHSRADGYIVGLPNLLLCGQQIRRRQHLSILADARRHRHPGIHHCKYEEMTLPSLREHIPELKNYRIGSKFAT